jgi:hypothetical protein
MADTRIFRRIGGKLRDESHDIVEARLPERLRALLDRLARVEDDRHANNGHGAR